MVALTTPYWLWKNGISERFLKLLDEDLAEQTFSPGKIVNGVGDTSIRNSDIVMFPGHHWFSSLLLNFGIQANSSAHWQRTLAFPETTQVAKYTPGQFYDWHSDTNFLAVDPNRRKLTAICMLTRRDEYEGGELRLEASPEIELDRGSVIVFPSELRHKVEPVIAGERRTATCWIWGPNNY